MYLLICLSVYVLIYFLIFSNSSCKLHFHQSHHGIYIHRLHRTATPSKPAPNLPQISRETRTFFRSRERFTRTQSFIRSVALSKRSLVRLLRLLIPSPLMCSRCERSLSTLNAKRIMQLRGYGCFGIRCDHSLSRIRRSTKGFNSKRLVKIQTSIPYLSLEGT